MKVSLSQFSIETIQNSLPVLPSEHSNLLRLYFIEKKSIKDISSELSISVAKTKQKIAKAILEVRRISNDPDYLKAIEILQSK